MKAKGGRKSTGGSGWRRFFRGLALALDIIAVCALLLTAYAGMVSPLAHSSLWGVLPLAFPIVLWCVCGLMVVQIIWHWRGTAVCAAGIILCAGPALDVCPLNFGTRKAPAGAQTFSLMSYNAHQFMPPHSNKMPDGDVNAQLQYIIDSDADIVCLQEATFLLSSGSYRLPQAQMDSLHRIYPYIFVTASDVALLSKYPAAAIHLDANRENFPGGNVGCYRVTLPDGRLVTIFNVHLHSMSLRPDDVEVYRKLTELKREDIGILKYHLLDKLRKAARGRARQVQQLLRYLRLYGGPDAIVTGDFNDGPCCYTLRTLADVGFHEVYPEVGLGPMVTFNADRMYFRIDHTLCRGAIRPLSMTKGKLKASDHYPLTTEFYIAR